MKSQMHGTSVATVDLNAAGSGPLAFWVEPTGDKPYWIDLTPFAEGGTRENLPTQNRWQWTSDFSGRPIMAYELAEQVWVRRPTKKAVDPIINAFRQFFRFLDTRPISDIAPCVDGVCDVHDAHGPLFLRWLRGEASKYQQVKTMLDRMLFSSGARPLFWAKRPRNDLSVNEPVDTVGLRRLNHVLRHEARAIERMFEEGKRLADTGVDPRDPPDRYDLWSSGANRAWLIRHLTVDNPIDAAELMRCRDVSFRKWQWTVPEQSWPDYQLAPTYTLPGMRDHLQFSLGGALRWFHPGYYDTCVFFWLFLIGTGWNLSTALAMDVSDDESWFQPHPHSPGFAVIHAFKNRADRHQFTVSMMKPTWHPFRIVKFMIERTEALRTTVRARLDRAKENLSADRSPANQAIVHDLEGMVRSPWLFASSNTLGEISCLKSNDTTRLTKLARDLAEREGLTDDHPSLTQVTTAAARDAWIGHAYMRSGYHVLLTRLASQHASAQTLAYYLRSRRYREHSELQIRKVQNAIFAEIAGGRVLDPTRLRLLVRNDTITPEQEQRLLDLRQRTRLGMGCLSPTTPPKHVAPDHKEGSLCRVQRCTGCAHGVVFAESRPALARAYAELIFIQRTIPMTAWSGSSFEDEKSSLEQTLANFDQAVVAAEVDDWMSRFKSGKEVPHDTYPSY
jgi:hypothetical protein